MATAPTSWIWRGQTDIRWPLRPRLARDFDRLPPFDDPSVSYDFIGLENRLLGFFKERARRVLDEPPEEHDLLGWLTLMQHYGAPTRLLDWSASPFVGLYFACSDLQAGEGVLWGIDAHKCRRQQRGSLFPTGWDHLGVIRHSTTDSEGVQTVRVPALETTLPARENEILRWAIQARAPWPLPVIPFAPDARMAAQQTVLTLIGDMTRPVEDLLLHEDQWHASTIEPPPGGHIIGTDSTMDPLVEPADVIVRVVVPADWRRDLLHSLAAMNIDESTLFPGLDGVGRETARFLQSGRGAVRDLITDSWF